MRATRRIVSLSNRYQDLIVRILPPPRVWIGARPGIRKPPVFWRLARLEKRLELGCATRNTTPQAPCTEPAWTLQNSKAIGQIREKPWENQGFAAERTGLELFDVFPMFLDSSKDRCRGIAMIRTSRSSFPSLENEGSPLTLRSLQIIMYLHWSTIAFDSWRGRR